MNKTQHQNDFKTGVLLANIGTPDAPTTKAVRKYLAEFLWDPRVVEIPRLLWWLILHTVVLRTKPQKSAKLYQTIWTDEGSPLLVNTQKQTRALQQHFGDGVKITCGMRYGKPSISDALIELERANVNKLLVLPLYPQYSATTTASIFDAIATLFKSRRYLPELRMIMGYHDHPDYIKALVNKIKNHWQNKSNSKKLLFSFHGLPKRNFTLGDPYYCFCHKTARLIAEGLELNDHEWQLCFQSRFNRQKWLKPYTVDTLVDLAKQGVKNVDMVCPGFASDCLETLEEITITNQSIFKKNGGDKINYIPALNADNEHINALTALIRDNIAGWKF